MIPQFVILTDITGVSQTIVNGSANVYLSVYNNGTPRPIPNDALFHPEFALADAAGNLAVLTATGQVQTTLYTSAGVAVPVDAANHLGVAIFGSTGNQLAITAAGALTENMSQVGGSNVTHVGGTQVVAAQGNGASANGSVGAVSAQIKAANASASWLTIQNTHATQDLYLSFTNPATVNDIHLGAGASITFNIAPTNAIFGIGSGAATTFAIMEVSAA